MSRKTDYPVLPVILNRWSSREMSGEEISEAELMALFDAARWAPSSYNGQPWRFIYVKRDDPEWENALALLVEFNQNWAKNAAVLVCTISRKTFTHNGKPCKTHSFDTGASWMSLAIQGLSMDLVVHGMQGFDYKHARAFFEISDEFEVEMMFAVGKPGPEELQKKEELTERNPLSDFVFHKKSGT